jgi:hypothetical protein
MMNDEFENLPPEEKEHFGTQNVVISLIGERSRVCCNDELAAAACQKLKERGINRPLGADLPISDHNQEPRRPCAKAHEPSDAQPMRSVDVRGRVNDRAIVFAGAH